MDNIEHKQPALFINQLDSTMRENIIKLDQKLNGLKAEVEAKLKSSARYNQEQEPALINRLQTIAQEIDKSLAGISALVSLVATKDEIGEAFLHGASMQKYSKQIAEDLEAISSLKDEL